MYAIVGIESGHAIVYDRDTMLYYFNHEEVGPQKVTSGFVPHMLLQNGDHTVGVVVEESFPFPGLQREIKYFRDRTVAMTCFEELCTPEDPEDSQEVESRLETAAVLQELLKDDIIRTFVEFWLIQTLLEEPSKAQVQLPRAGPVAELFANAKSAIAMM